MLVFLIVVLLLVLVLLVVVLVVVLMMLVLLVVAAAIVGRRLVVVCVAAVVLDLAVGEIILKFGVWRRACVRERGDAERGREGRERMWCAGGHTKNDSARKVRW